MSREISVMALIAAYDLMRESEKSTKEQRLERLKCGIAREKCGINQWIKGVENLYTVVCNIQDFLKETINDLENIKTCKN